MAIRTSVANANYNDIVKTKYKFSKYVKRDSTMLKI
jgi:hypothetical protein